MKRNADSILLTAHGTWVNDVHSGSSRTLVDRVVPVDSTEAVSAVVSRAQQAGRSVSVCGGRHAMGAQAFATGAVLLDTAPMTRISSFDRTRGVITVGAGIRWPALIDELATLQPDDARPWTIRQKQTGADALSLGGALAANIHGRGLRMRPFVDDVEAITLVDAAGDVVRADRLENRELFSLVAGGYGLFGVVTEIELRLTRRRRVRRRVEMIDANELPGAFAARIADGFEYGDFQFAIDPRSDDFLWRGVFSCYEPLHDEDDEGDGIDEPAPARALDDRDWTELLWLAHTDKSRGFERYAAHYLSTDGALYHSDTHQLTTYVDGYHEAIDQRLGHASPHGEMITELYVPRAALPAFLTDLADDLRAVDADVIYGTVRLVEADDVSFLRWARAPFACVVLNLCMERSADGERRAKGQFRALIDRALAFGGSFYLTYHRYATREQVEQAYPMFREFLRLKDEVVDPDTRFASDWWRHYRAAFTA